MSIKRWHFAKIDGDAVARLEAGCRIDRFLAKMLVARGIADPKDADEILNGGGETADPFLLADMDRAVSCVREALRRGEKIAVFGDYDVDGITATALMVTYLREKGADVCCRIPRREEEGYGLSKEAVRAFAEEGVGLLITVDNGISSGEEVQLANELGLRVVVTDHHQPQGMLPPAAAVVDPHRADCESPFKDYAGVGVALKLVCALEGSGDAVARYADLAAMGTLADVMPLIGENRGLVREGLRKLNTDPLPGIMALADAAGAAGRPFTAGSVTYTLAPRINAAGRMGDPNRALRLILETDPAACAALAAEINEYNRQRQICESEISESVFAYVDRHPEVMAQRVLVIEGDRWHPGVVGILAARIADKFGKPCILLSVNGDIAKGSGRSVEGFSLFDALAACADVLDGYGGHRSAAGLSVQTARIGEFRERINAYAAQYFPQMPVTPLRMDFPIAPQEADLFRTAQIGYLEPFGAGNPAPLFGLLHMTVERIFPAGEKHTRLSLLRDGVRVSAVRFGENPEQMGLCAGDTVDLAVSLEHSEYRSRDTVSVIVRDWRYGGADEDRMIRGVRLYDRLIRREALEPGEREALLPTREEAAALYRAVMRRKSFTGSLQQLHHLVNGSVPFEKLLPALGILRQAGVLQSRDRGDFWVISAGDALQKEDAPQKADLTQTPLWQALAC